MFKFYGAIDCLLIGEEEEEEGERTAVQDWQ